MMRYTIHSSPRSRTLNTARAPVDVIELENAYLIRANLPGFTKDEISVEADFESLRFTAEKEPVESEEEITYLLRERRTSKVSRTMTFAKPVNASGAKVSLDNGVLEITIPLADNARKVKLIPNEGPKLIEGDN